MANLKHLELIKQGPELWNVWRERHLEVKPNLCLAYLHEANLREADLSEANLRESTLSGANLREANLSVAKLREAELTGANLSEADLSGANLHEATLYKADLTRANLLGANLRKANLREADLTRAILTGTDLSEANLCEANLREADLTRATLFETNLSEANLREVNLREATFIQAVIFKTIFSNVDLSSTKGLDSCRHHGPSILDHRTLENSGPLPEAFLRDCGLSDWQIEAAKLHQRDLTSSQITDIVYRINELRSTRPIQVNNLFISYSHADAEFVDHIEEYLSERGIRYWRDIHDAPAGPLESIVVRAMQNATVLLVLSEHSVKSDWVEFEAQKARELEKGRDRPILCPIALDDAWKTCNWSGVLRNQIRKYNVLDFSNWGAIHDFEDKFERLLEGISLFYTISEPDHRSSHIGRRLKISRITSSDLLEELRNLEDLYSK